MNTMHKEAVLRHPPLIGSQLEPVFNNAVQERLQLPLRTISRGLPTGLDIDIQILVAAPWIFAGQTEALETSTPPLGWPYGLKWIQLLTSGVDAYPRWFLETVPVTTARGVAAEPIAEFVMGAILCAAKQLPQAWITSPEDWQPRWLDCVSDSTVAVLGFGPIGQAVAKKALALGARVLVLRKSNQPLDLPGAEQVSNIEELVSHADHLVLAAPASAGNVGIINAKVLATAKSGLHLINVGRGDLIDDDALLSALNSHQVRLATLDTTVPEPLPMGHPYYKHDRVRISPHISGVSRHTRVALAVKFVENYHRFLGGLPLLNQL